MTALFVVVVNLIYYKIALLLITNLCLCLLFLFAYSGVRVACHQVALVVLTWQQWRPPLVTLVAPAATQVAAPAARLLAAL